MTSGRSKLACALAGALLAAPLGAWASGFLTPADFGGLEGGAVDASAAIQSALNADGRVFLAGGTWLVQRPVIVPAEGQITGPGTIILQPAESPPQPRLVLSGAGSALRDFTVEVRPGIAPFAPLVASNTTGATLRGLRVSGEASVPMVVLNNASEFQLVGNTFTLGASHSPPAVAASGALEGLLQGNTFERTAWSGTPLELVLLEDCTRVAIARNHFGPGTGGLSLAGSTGTLVAANAFSSLCGEAIVASDSSRNAFQGNNFTSVGSGIRFVGPGLPGGDCEPRVVLPRESVAGVVGSVVGGTEDPSSEGDTLARVGDGSFTNRAAIGQASTGAFSFVLDTGEATVMQDVVLVTVADYRPAGQFPGGSATVEVASSLAGPWTSVGSATLECSRPPADGMTTTTPEAAATRTEARRIPFTQAVEARYVRVGATFCLDNIVLMSEAWANGGPMLRRLRPLNSTIVSGTSVPIRMTDGSRATATILNTTSGFVDIDLAPFPVELTEVRLVGVTGQTGYMPRAGRVLVSSLDDGNFFDTIVASFDQSPVGRESTIPIPAGTTARHVRIEWDALVNAGLTQTRLSEIEFAFTPACQITIDHTWPNGNVVDSNVFTDLGEPPCDGAPAGAAWAVDARQAVMSNVRANAAHDLEPAADTGAAFLGENPAVGNVFSKNLDTSILPAAEPAAPTTWRLVQ